MYLFAKTRFHCNKQNVYKTLILYYVINTVRIHFIHICDPLRLALIHHALICDTYK